MADAMNVRRPCPRSASCEESVSLLLQNQEVDKIYKRLSVPVFPARQTDREEIRRKLAMGGDEDYYGGERALKKPSLSTRLQGGMNLQICFMNDAAASTSLEDSEVTSSSSGETTTTTNTTTSTNTRSNTGNVFSSSSMSSSSSTTTTTAMPSSSSAMSSQSHQNLSWVASSSSGFSSSSSASASASASPGGVVGGHQGSSSSSSSFASPSSSSASSSSVKPSPVGAHLTSSQGSKSRPKSDPGLLASQLSLPPSDETPTERQQRLQLEARMALAQASNMARMQLEVERKTKKKSPIAQIVGVPELGEGRRMKISRKLLQEMNLAQLQVLVNDLHSQIENLNEDLVHLLIERDDLHMEQDSQLVDIEDLTSFTQHMSETNNNKTTQNNRNSSIPKSKKLK